MKQPTARSLAEPMKCCSLGLFGAILLAACQDTPQVTQPEAAASQQFSASAVGPSAYKLRTRNFDNRQTAFRAISRNGLMAGAFPGGVVVLRKDAFTWLQAGGFSGRARDINVHRQVAGFYRIAGENRAAIWGTDGELTDLGPGVASGINDGGQATGLFCHENPCLTSTAFIWDDGVLTLLNEIPNSGAQDISARGQVVGRMDGAGDVIVAFSWENGELTELATLGGTSSSADGVNIHGQVVGSSSVSDGTAHAVLWERGAIIELGLPGESRALRINDRGQVVGWFRVSPEPPRAFVWQDGIYTVLPELDGATWTIAEDINNLGQIVGQSRGDFSPRTMALIWEVDRGGRGGGPPSGRGGGPPSGRGGGPPSGRGGGPPSGRGGGPP